MLKNNKLCVKHVYGKGQETTLKKCIHELFDKVALEEQRMVVHKSHALELNFTESFQHDFSMFHFARQL